MKKKLPEFLKPYFWDVDFEKLSVSGKPEFIVNRLLNQGNLDAALWVRGNYPDELVKKVLKTQRDFSLKRASFWGMMYGVPKSEIKCFQEPYYTIRRTLWPY